MGKSGHIGCKIAATLASTGTPAFFVHPGEASHGDLGMDLHHKILCSPSLIQRSNEILALIPVLKRQKIPLICMSNNPDISMGKAADIHLCIKVPQEACPLGLAPTTSTTATLVMGDALAVALLQAHWLHSKKILPSPIRAEHWGASCYCESAISCTRVRDPAHQSRCIITRCVTGDYSEESGFNCYL